MMGGFCRKCRRFFLKAGRKLCSKNEHDPNMKYELQLWSPEEFYPEVHRPAHFLNFSSLENGDGEGADWEDLVA
jgi:hypothetical protein